MTDGGPATWRGRLNLSTKGAPVAFATRDDVAARLGRPLTDEENTSVGFLLDAATAIVAAAADVDVSVDPVPPVLRYVTVEVVCRALANPSWLASESETLGAYSRTERFRAGDSGGGLWLTELETQMVRRAAHRRLSGTALQQSIATDPCVLGRVAPASYRRGMPVDEGGS